MVPASRAKLQEAPTFDSRAMGADDTDWRERVHSHYDAPAYWV